MIAAAKGESSFGTKYLKVKLGMDNPNLFKFMKAKLIRGYSGNDLALNIKTPEA